MKMELTECSETSEHKIQTPENHPKERMQHSEQDASLKSRIKRTLEYRTSKNSTTSYPVSVC
jgi:hypothetical protein